MKKKIKDEDRIICDNFDTCRNFAEYNLQNRWHLYNCEKDGSYTKNREWEGDENNHYCEECADAEGII